MDTIVNLDVADIGVKFTDIDTGQPVVSDYDTEDVFVDLLSQLRQEHERVIRNLKFGIVAAHASCNNSLNGQRDSPLQRVEPVSEQTFPEEARETVKQVLMREIPKKSIASESATVISRPFSDSPRLSYAGTTPLCFELGAMWTSTKDHRPSERWEHWLHEPSVEMHVSNLKAFRNQIDGSRSVRPSGYHGQKVGALQRSVGNSSLSIIYKLPCRCHVVSPIAQKRVIWDMFGMLLLAYDLTTIPMILAFDPEVTTVTEVIGWLTLLFWTADMALSVNTGFYVNGKLVMDRSQILRKYLKGWFWLDLVVVVPDWVQKALLGNLTPASGLGRALRAVRIFRVLRLLRLLKLGSMLSRLYDLIDSEYHFIWFNLLKMIIMIWFLNHIVACGFYAIGNWTKDQNYDKNWLQDRGLVPVWGATFGWKYITSLHWAITQFTPASMDVSATNEPERIFSVIVLFWALVVLSSLIGSVSASMTALRSLSSDGMTKFWILRRFLRQQTISKPLCDRILKYLEYKQMTNMNIIHTSQVALLRELSEPLRMQMEGEMMTPVLFHHPFFAFLIGDTPMVMHRLSCSALKVASHAYDDHVFHPGDAGTRMYFIKSGSFKYKLSNQVALSTPLEVYAWVSEASMWTTWRHRGYFIARQPADTIDVTPETFCGGLHQHPNALRIARQYGLKFIAHLNVLPTGEICDVMYDDDTWAGFVRDAKLRISPSSQTELL